MLLVLCRAYLVLLRLFIFVLQLTAESCTDLIRRETCFQDEEYELMSQCCRRQPSQRPEVAKVKKRLSELLEDAGR